MHEFKEEETDDPVRAYDQTLRERANAELKEQIRKHAELVCKILDDREEQIKRYEKQCRVLAEEIDRLRLAS